jgi:hypothetical protein
MKPHDEGHASDIVVRAHAPERLVRTLAGGHIAGAGCCCCCCCLHSVGSLTGAAIGSFYPRESPSPGDRRPSAKFQYDELDGPPREVASRSPTNSIYWLVTLGMSVLAFMFSMAGRGEADIRSAGVDLAVYIPAIQLGASLFCMLMFGGILELRRDSRVWKRLGFITLWSIVGCLLGYFAMKSGLVQWLFATIAR